MALKFKDDEGDLLFELKVGQQLAKENVDRVVAFCAFAQASEVELEVCNHILGRNAPGPTHVFNSTDTEEIILNLAWSGWPWSR